MKKSLRRKLLLVSMAVLGLSACASQGPQGEAGPKGETGRSVVQILKTGSEGNVDTYTIVYSDSSTSTFTVTNGKDGEAGHSPVITINDDGYWCVDGIPTSVAAKGDKGDSIADVTYSYDESGNTVVKIILSSGEERYFTIPKGDKGDQGPQGEKGDKGDQGDAGVSVASIAKTSSEGNKDTYTITYSDGSTSTFVITNGQDGAQGIQGIPGKDGHSPVISIGENGNWLVDGVDTGMKAQGPKGDKGEDAITYIPCIFNNYDGTKLYEFFCEKGGTITYEGPTPTKTTHNDFGMELNWSFTGWDQSLENIQEPTIFTAQFEYLFTCTFVNYDGTVLEKTQVNYGDSATYTGSTPVRPSETYDGQALDWSFTGWDKSLDNIKEDTLFTALFDAPKSVKLTFQNEDGTLLYTQYCRVNANVKYEGPTPKKADEEDKDGNITRYEFMDWNKPLEGLVRDTTFTATYSEHQFYRCRFFDEDGALLYTTAVLNDGYARYQGITPTKDQTAEGTEVTEYTFSGWDKSQRNIVSSTDFYPLFTTNSFTGYKVTFLDSDGKTELYSHYFEENQPARYPYETPWSYDDENVTMFFGWSGGSLTSINQETTVTMRLKTISRAQNGEYPQVRVTDGETYNALSLLPQSPDDGYVHYQGERYEIKYGYYYKVEPIKWRYLGQDDDSALLLSDKILDNHRYNAMWNDVDENGYLASNYKQSEIRKWLNNDFLDKTFEKPSLIKTTSVDNSVSTLGTLNSAYVCETTYDKVFLLSYKDVNDPSLGFFADVDRATSFTDYAEMGLSWTGANIEEWWLRSPGRSNRASTVDLNGYVHSIGEDVDCGFDSDKLAGGIVACKGNPIGVRPAIRINLK